MNRRPWQSSYGTIPPEIDADAYSSVAAMLDEAMEKFRAEVAFVSGGNSFTYGQIDEFSRNLAAYLQQNGVCKGDRVAVMLPNIAAFPIASIAIARAGAVQVAINPLYTARELEHQLSDSGSEWIICYSDALSTVQATLPKTECRHVIMCGPPTQGDLLGSAALNRATLDVPTIADAISMGGRVNFQRPELCGEDMFLLQYTGGTTGISKGAMLTHRNLVANVGQFEAYLRAAMRPGSESVLTAIPLYHIFAFTLNFLTCFRAGAKNWLVDNPRDLGLIIETLKQARPSVVTGVNTLYAGLAHHPQIAEVDWSQLRLAVGGGASIARAVSDLWREITGVFIHEGYGMSETSPAISFVPVSVEEFTGTVGLPVPSTGVKLLNLSGDEVPLGDAGEICVRGPQLMKGYWRNPEATAAALTSDGFFRTGDIGQFDDRGFLRIVDRKKDVILVSGFNVFPNEVEDVVASCEGVAECACIGVPDARTGEAVTVYVACHANYDITAEQIRQHCRGLLAAYKIPKSVYFVASLPKSGVGKILRQALRQKAQQTP